MKNEIYWRLTLLNDNNNKETTFYTKTKNYLVTHLYLNDRSRFSLFLIGVLGSFPMIIFMSYVGLHLEDIGTVAWLIALILAFRNIYQLFLRVPLGQLSQMIGRKPLLLTGVGFYALSLFTLFLSTHWSIVLVAITFLAIGMSCYWPILFAFIGDIEKENIGQLQGRVFQGTDLGTILGSLLAVLLLDTLSTEIRYLFGWGSLITFIGLIGISFLIPEVLAKEDRLKVDSRLKAMGTAFVDMFRNLAKATKHKKLRFIYLLQLLIAFLEYIVTAFFPFLVVSKGFPDETVSTIFWISAGSLILFKPYFGKIVDKFSYKIPIFITLTFSSLMLTLMVFMDSLPWLIVVYILFSASSLTSYIGVNTGTTVEAPFNQRGLALGALGFYVSLSRSVSTLSFSPILLTHEVSTVINTIFFVTAGSILSLVILVGIIHFFRNKNNIEKKADMSGINQK